MGLLDIFKSQAWHEKEKEKQTAKARVLCDWRVFFEISLKNKERTLTLGNIRGSAVVSGETARKAEIYLKEVLKEQIEINITWPSSEAIVINKN